MAKKPKLVARAAVFVEYQFVVVVAAEEGGCEKTTGCQEASYGQRTLVPLYTVFRS